ncbi:MAG: 7-cyano-7-deazaguanine synthase [Cenarchaeum sp. SB0665_bin_23]|nr:7-cyano-7-deazaguanine synthase [Cenarchaeum sp. SB0667_bin_13]MXY37421.1 7-cyano-7-deazaguanine synthase [Cenarchaeum sp. SB0664_bin_35]MXY60833.1 7-cyano-7-deazaguanine synthase [Cenarchaeum sp. SB0665_bin_23]MXZ92892.1 7-cyano-7-deazaguanine synthase [Cenarchaeum sp. SB0666_bin_15]MYB46372.1 7-cyano-7-deazaguanine synthase [Cenarchaeum sp. SB0662_bin_33]MYC79112.1 7-cyano-7-deazaguanine synthase [Cenarchaeum sp. SB0661_bin_35]MYD59195.1 7-cyano-7-deazaguanine synthase [Cenarchaeum sp. S
MKAVMVFSGGIDSVCTASYLSKRYDVYGMSFLYGQRAGPEIESAKYFADKIGMKQHHTLDISFMEGLYGKSNALTDSELEMPQTFNYSIVVPVRNAVFLSISSAWAFSLGAELVAYGAHTGDTSYPDCRPIFTDAFEKAMNLGESDGISNGVRLPLKIWSPYKEGMSKSTLLQMGMDALGDDIFLAWSCYSGGDKQCGICESCHNRKNAFIKADIQDKTIYNTSSGF